MLSANIRNCLRPLSRNEAGDYTFIIPLPNFSNQEQQMLIFRASEDKLNRQTFSEFKNRCQAHREFRAAVMAFEKHWFSEMLSADWLWNMRLMKACAMEMELNALCEGIVEHKLIALVISRRRRYPI